VAAGGAHGRGDPAARGHAVDPGCAASGAIRARVGPAASPNAGATCLAAWTMRSAASATNTCVNSVASAATGRAGQLLAARERALDRVAVDDDVGDVGEDVGAKRGSYRRQLDQVGPSWSRSA
jgi:hypothetical protein